MKITFVLMISLMLMGQAFASKAFKNIIEGDSSYLTKKLKQRVASYGFYRNHYHLEWTFNKFIKESKLCTYGIHERMAQHFGSHTKAKYYYYYARKKNQIDDVILERLVRQVPMHQTEIKYYESPEQLDSKSIKKIERHVTEKVIKRMRCITEDVPRVVNKLKTEFDVQESKKILSKLRSYYYHNPSTAKLMKPLIKYVEEEGDLWKLNIKDYISLKNELYGQLSKETITAMSTQEKSKYATEYLKKEKRTRRQKLYEDYDFIQIIFLKDIIAELVRDLKAVRLDHVLYNENGDEVARYEADPNEQFCLTIKLMRKKIATIRENFFFEKKTTTFEDTMMAALETGVISTHEFDSVLGFKELWDPEKSFWEKHRLWIQTFGSLSGVILPPPWGAIPMLAIMAIEAVHSVKNGQDMNPLHNICRMQ
jgi:hypothetical protein